MERGFEGKGALVTGGGSGIGKATAMMLASRGAAVTILGRTEEKLDSAADEIRRTVEGARIATFVGDITSDEELGAGVDAATELTGALDVMFACAGGSHHMGEIANAPAEAFAATVELNLQGSFLSVKHAARVMKPRRSGSIILMSSGAGHFVHRWLGAYGVSKAGIEALCDYAAEELADHSIRVNVVQPGLIDDELVSMITAGGALLDDYLEQTPIARLGTVEDVAAAVCFLASDEASWITGEHLAIDGGHHLRRGADYTKLFG